MQRLLIDKANLNDISSETLSKVPLADNQVLLKIDSFGLSANNITYAVLGDAFGYWGFFPAENNKGVMPVWGFAEVAESTCPGIEVGKRVFGYLPFASHLLVQASSITANGFMDTHPQRKSISPVYDQYVFCDTDPGYRPKLESWQITFRPLFMTSFVLADFVESLDENIDTIILTSASSKTAFGTAMLFRANENLCNSSGERIKVIGLTSSRNTEFVEQLDCYDQVVEYSNIGEIAAEKPAVVLDFAGNKQTLLSLQKHFATSSLKSILIGATDVEGRNVEVDEHVNGDVFFAPSQVKLRQKEWGPAMFFGKYQQAWEMFLNQVQDKIEEVNVIGFDDMQVQYQKALKGEINPQQMLILKP
ncbi:DUF2855 family protein [Glaciecola petra]|uniref:DUF2855 family protein n=1 Tax=Glaciecola petra TaxID=3075602 RepID=A0ABU2ZTD2_9ALTE|nr:DUF2855 family protein [Aestuariibacter sp. P117]MDT0595904.1 DUF2855 family protein [Aestuariibacter sp. P117]